MEPTPQEVEVIKASTNPLEAAVAWVGVTPETLAALQKEVGEFTLMREVLYIGNEDWNAGIEAAKVQSGGSKGKEEYKPLKALQKGHLGCLRIALKTVLGVPRAMPPGGLSAVPAAAASTALGSAGGPASSVPGWAPAGTGERKASMKATIDQTDETEFVAMGPAEFRKFQRTFEAGNDNLEASDAEKCTGDQLKAVQIRLQHAFVPYMDLALVRPFSARMAKAMTFVTQVWSPEKCAYEPRRIKGPCNLKEWRACYKVVSYILRTLGAVDRTRLERYEAKIVELDDSYGGESATSGWYLVALADMRMRSEYMDKILARLESKQAAHMAITGATASLGPLPDETRPWNAVWLTAAEDSDKFWFSEVQEKALLFQTHIKTRGQLVDAGHHLQEDGRELSEEVSAPTQGAGSLTRWQRKAMAKAAKGGGAKGGGQGGAHAQQQLFPPVANQFGGGKGYWSQKAAKGKGKGKGKKSKTAGCWEWNRAADGCTDDAAACPKRRPHICEFCGGAHRSVSGLCP